MITRNEMIEFCKQRTAMHLAGISNIDDTDGLADIKRKSMQDLANKYNAIRMFLEDPSITAIVKNEDGSRQTL